MLKPARPLLAAAFVAACGGGAEADEQVPIAELRGGRYDTCTLYEDGRLRCWGNLGLISIEPAELGSKRVVDLRLGAYFACMLLDSHEVKCWGDASRGQLGLDPMVGPQTWRPDLPAVDLGADVRAAKLGVGAFHACAVTETSQVKCWGHNIYGQLGLGDTTRRGDTGTMGNALPFVEIGAGVNPLELALGLDPSCVLLDGGNIKCWGANYNGSLGVGDYNHRGDEPGEMGDALPLVNLTGERVLQIATGGHTCALLEGGRVKCWGANSFGQLGLGDTGNRSAPVSDSVDLGPGEKAVRLTLGLLHTCVLLETGAVKCWGQNLYGQLGVANPDPVGNQSMDMGVNLPAVSLGDGGARVRSLATGEHHTCALLENNEVWCWGENTQGQLGLGHTNNVFAPAQLPRLLLDW